MLVLLTFALRKEHLRYRAMRPKGSAKALEMRRRIAAKLLQEGKGIREMARLVGASPSTVLRWKGARTP